MRHRDNGRAMVPKAKRSWPWSVMCVRRRAGNRGGGHGDSGRVRDRVTSVLKCLFHSIRPQQSAPCVTPPLRRRGDKARSGIGVQARKRPSLRGWRRRRRPTREKEMEERRGHSRTPLSFSRCLQHPALPLLPAFLSVYRRVPRDAI